MINPTRFEAIPSVSGNSFLVCEAKINGVTKNTIHLGEMNAEIAAFIVKSANSHADLLKALNALSTTFGAGTNSGLFTDDMVVAAHAAIIKATV